MATTKVSNRFYVTAINDGSSVSVALMNDKPLAQVYNPLSGNCVPNWTDSTKQPTAFAVVRINGSIKAPVANTDQWYYNTTLLTFDSTTQVSTGQFAGKFQRLTNYTVDGKLMPALKIIDNLAVAGNYDQDTLTLKGQVEAGGYNIDYSVSTCIRITQQATSGYYGYVQGDSYVTSGTSGTAGYTANMEAYLYNGDDPVIAYKTVWVREGVDEPDEDLTDSWPKTIYATNYVANCSINASEIVDYVVIRVDFYDSNDAKVFSAFWDVDDMQDMEEMYITHGTMNQNNASLRKDENVDFKIWMGKRTNQFEIDPHYNTFKVKMLNSEGNTVPCSLSETTNNTIQKDTVSGTEYVDITKQIVVGPTGSTVTVPYGGLVRITYDFAHDLGDTITGIIVASYENNQS